MSVNRPVQLPVNSSGRHINFGLNPGPQIAQQRFLDIPHRTVVSSVAFPPSPTTPGNTGSTGTLGIQYIQSDMIILTHTGITGTASYVLPSAGELLQTFSDLNVGKALRFWVANKGAINATLVSSPTGQDSTYNTLTIPPFTANGTIADATAGHLSQFVNVTLLFTSVNGSTGTEGQYPIPLAGSTGTYQLL